MKKNLFILSFVFLQVILFGQFKTQPANQAGNTHTFSDVLDDVINIRENSISGTNYNESADFRFNTLTSNKAERINIPSLKAYYAPGRTIPLALYGSVPFENVEADDFIEKSFQYLENAAYFMGINDVRKKFIISEVIEDQEHGLTHVKMKQLYYGIPFYGGEVIIHYKNGQSYLMNGFWFTETPRSIPEGSSGRDQNNLFQVIIEDLQKMGIETFREQSKTLGGLIDIEPWQSELVYYKLTPEDELRLVHHVTANANIAEKWQYFIEAGTNKILQKFPSNCKLLHAHQCNHMCESHTAVNGSEKAYAPDLANITRELNVYKHNNTYYLTDASRSMFDAANSQMPDKPKGVIWTLDAKNTSPENSNFKVEHITSTNNSWTNKTAVSAHYNAQRSFDYYSGTFNRNSYDDLGGNIISIINVTESDGTQMDNAFWSGKAMFYGNGNEAFYSLARALDVAGHEITHGVIQATADLEYYGESGAINESFADIFGCMIEGENWKLGESIVKLTAFPSGALRDMSNPNNGGTNINQPGYQPAHVSQQYKGSLDNGGVHINSGIPNFAFYKFATAVGNDKAQRVFYKALTSYLTKSSKFVDLRMAVEQASYDLYGLAVKEAASTAFEAVGIKGTSTGQPNNYENDLAVNPGEDLILYYEEGFFDYNLVIADNEGNVIANSVYNGEIISKPSVTDNGSEVVFVGADNKIHYVYLDWDSGQYQHSIIQNDPIWRNVSISKDGWRIAAITQELDANIHVFDFELEQWKSFEIYIPSTAEGVIAGKIDYIDVMEFNYSGEWILFDAQNTIKSQFGSDIEYWDIGFVQVFDHKKSNFADGLVQKLFSALPENTSIGNPTFSKNSPYIIAFDYLSTDEYLILGSNLETGTINQIFETNTLGYPNFSRLDNQLLFNYDDFWGSNVAILDLASNKIEYLPNTAEILIPGGKWGIWFSNGTRSLSLDSEDLNNQENILKIWPNPAHDRITLDWENAEGHVSARIVDLLGQVYVDTNTESNSNGQFQINVGHIPVGSYIIQLGTQDKTVSKKLIISH